MEDLRKEFNFLIIIREGDKIQEKCREYCKAHPNIHSYFIVSNNFEKEIESLKDIKLHMVCCSSFFAFHIPYLLKNFPTLKWVHSFAAGVERFLRQKEIKENKEIILSNSKGAYSEAFGEGGIASMMYFAYNFPLYIESQQNKDFKRQSNRMIEGKNLLIVGYGNNGICLARRAKLGFNMKVVGIVRTLRDNIEGKEFTDEIYETKNIPSEVINKADYVYATLPSTKETFGYFNKEWFSKMNKDAVFLNVGRGTAVVEDDIIDALEKGVIRGAALDVTFEEPRNKDSKLYNLPTSKLLLTNHSIGNVGIHTDRSFEVMIQNLENYLEKGIPLNLVNKEREY